MPSPDLNAIRQNVLARMERHQRNVRLAIVGAALAEAALFALALWRIDFSNRFESTVFLLFVLSYTILGLGMVALGAHVSRVGDRVLSVLDPAGRD